MELNDKKEIFKTIRGMKKCSDVCILFPKFGMTAGEFSTVFTLFDPDDE
jgi:hypothetical protein